MEHNEDALNLLVINVKRLIQLNKLDDAFVLLEKQIAPISSDLETSILLNQSSFNDLQQKISDEIIAEENATIAQNKIKRNLIKIMERIPSELETLRIMSAHREPSIYKSTSDGNLEKILGTTNNLLKINWLEKALKASKSVCQIVRADGVRGTGFLLKGGYVMTNFHVLPNKEKAAAAKIVLDYEEDLLGNMRKTSEFMLDATDAKFSPIGKFDYAYIKIKDNPAKPLSQWGILEVDTFSEPQIDSPVTIIQHPLGQTKQIALTANKIINKDGKKLFYETDTERGSSGSPVFNNEWKVIALHHAGKTEEDGGLVVNAATGERRGANEGILIKDIVADIGKEI